MWKVILLFIFVLTSSSTVKADRVKDAELLFNSGQYLDAYEIYFDQMTRNSRDYMMKYKAARCLLKMERYDEAIELFGLCASRRIYQSYYYIYEAEYAMCRYDKAALAIDSYMKEVKLNDEGMQQASRLLEKALEALRMEKNSVAIEISDSVKLSKAELLNGYGLDQAMGRLFYEQNSSERQLVGYETGRGDKRISVADVDNRLKLTAQYRNLSGWGSTTAIDITLNDSTAQCNYPFELSDGITLYFASTGGKSIGGYDIFMTRYNTESGTYTEPRSVGMPFNSPANDYLLVIDDVNNHGWFATDRRQHRDSVVIYQFIPDTQQALPDTIDNIRRRRYAMLADYNGSETLRRQPAGNNYSNRTDTNNENQIKTPQDTSSIQNDLRADIRIDFRINDQVVYHSTKDFNNDDAKGLYSDLKQTERTIATKQILLQGKRREYETSISDADKKILRTEVVDLEQEIGNLQQKVKNTIREIRRLETAVLSTPQ